jgi:hypothetical protein
MREAPTTVPCPALEWRAALEECGPAEDRSIMLRGGVRIGGASFAVLAIRINREMRGTPDYKTGLPSPPYQTEFMETTLDELEYLIDMLDEFIGSTSRSVVELKTGPYVAAAA